MRIYIVIPVHNEEGYLSRTLQSLVNQTFLPSNITVVNDHSTDNTQSIIDTFASEYPFIQSITITSEAINTPGSKVVNAFYSGFETLDEAYDIICKFDADLIFPKNYLETIKNSFQKNPQCGLSGGFCYIEKKDGWILENLTNKEHLRGALKAYRKECFKQIGGLKRAMGWDTVDELLARYHGWSTHTDESLQVKHLKATGATYSQRSGYLQGEAFYKMRYGIVLTKLAALKIAYKKRSISMYINMIFGFLKAAFNGVPFMVSKEEGKFIRRYRWQGVWKKLF